LLDVAIQLIHIVSVADKIKPVIGHYLLDEMPGIAGFVHITHFYCHMLDFKSYRVTQNEQLHNGGDEQHA